MSERDLVEQQKAILRLKDLDRFALKKFLERPSGGAYSLKGIVKAIQFEYPQLSDKYVSSVLRNWYRKRRESIRSRIVSYLQKEFGNELKTPETRDNLRTIFSDPHFNWKPILSGVFPLSEEDTISSEMAQLCREKVLSHIERL